MHASRNHIRSRTATPALRTAAVLLPVVLLLAACAQTKYVVVPDVQHRYFLEVDRPGSVFAVLYGAGASDGGAFVRLLEIDAQRRSLGDTLTAWVQHFARDAEMAPEARSADLVIACHREAQPRYARERHVLPESAGRIYVYMMRGGILVVSDERIPYYEVLVEGGSVQGML